MKMDEFSGWPAPDDPERYLRPLPDAPATREELVAAVGRLQDENEASWNRFLWGEQRYAVDRAVRLGRKVATKAVRDGRRAIGRLRRAEPDDGPRP